MCLYVCVLYVYILQENSNHHWNLAAGGEISFGSERMDAPIFHTPKVFCIFSGNKLKPLSSLKSIYFMN